MRKGTTTRALVYIEIYIMDVQNDKYIKQCTNSMSVNATVEKYPSGFDHYFVFNLFQGDIDIYNI